MTDEHALMILRIKLMNLLRETRKKAKEATCREISNQLYSEAEGIVKSLGLLYDLLKEIDSGRIS